MLPFTLAAHSQEPPWSERAVLIHVDQKDLRGELPTLVLEELRRRGEELFAAKFTPDDGAGRPTATQAAKPTKRAVPTNGRFHRGGGPDANSCVGCHNQPAIGGAGDFVTNIFIREQPGGERAPIPNPSLTNERGTTHIFGAGLIELLAREMTEDLHAIRQKAVEKAARNQHKITAVLETKGVNFGMIGIHPNGSTDTSGVEGVDADLVIKPFGQKGVFTSLREFTVHVLNHHHGIQANERFGLDKTGELDFDGDGVVTEFSEGDVSAMVAWQAGLNPPRALELEDKRWATAAEKGQGVFHDLGCASCHIPALPLENLKFADPGPFNSKGTLTLANVPEPAIYDLSKLAWSAQLPRDEQGRILVPLFGDLKRHNIAYENDPLGNELLPQRGVEPGVFLTAELWGMASTAPYGHRNDFVTIDEIIRAHGGKALTAAEAYATTTNDDRSSLIAFLRSLAIMPVE